MFDVVITGVNHGDTSNGDVFESVSMLADQYLFETTSQNQFGADHRERSGARGSRNACRSSLVSLRGTRAGKCLDPLRR